MHSSKPTEYREQTMLEMMMASPALHRRWRAGLRRGAILAVTVLTAACNQIIGVEDSPSRVIAKDAEVPGNASLLVDGVVNDFECAFGRYVVMGGLLGNELRWASSSPWGRDTDTRTMDPATGLYGMYTCASGLSVYKPLSGARWMGDHVLELLDSWTDADVPNRTALIARASAYTGYSYVMLGEAMCSVAFDGGPELPPDSAFARAAERFERAVGAAGSVGDDATLNLARVGYARALLNLGRANDAATIAAQVPAGFVAYAQYDATPSARNNYVFGTLSQDRDMSVDVPFRDVKFAGTADPRVAVEEEGVGSDLQTPLYVPSKYADQGADIELATWVEAQLIIAEARGGSEAVDIINQLHDLAGLPHFSSSDPAEISRQIIYERQAEFFLESQHLGDMRRYGLDFYPAAGQPYVGTGSGTYGDQTCFPQPDSERNNNTNM
jgi:hypothetical protein